MEISITAVLAQIINFGLLFFLFKKFLTKPIVAAIEERRTLISRLENAEEAYEERLAAGEKEFKKMVQQGIDKKDQLVAEAGVIATKRKDEILEEAKVRAEEIVHDAETKTKNLEDELKNNFEAGVKRTSLQVVKKLLKDDKEFKSKYLDSVVSDLV